MTTNQTAAPVEARDVDEFQLRLTEYGVAMLHRQSEKAKVLFEVLESMYVVAATPPAQAAPVDHYATAFYKIAELMNIPAQPATPERVFNEQMLPKLRGYLREIQILTVERDSARATIDRSVKSWPL